MGSKYVAMTTRIVASRGSELSTSYAQTTSRGRLGWLESAFEVLVAHQIHWTAIPRTTFGMILEM